jgi:hypothetical protein
VSRESHERKFTHSYMCPEARCVALRHLAMKNREWLDKGIDPRRAVDRLGKRNSGDVHRRARDQPQQACTRGYLRPVGPLRAAPRNTYASRKSQGLPSLVAAIVGQTSHRGGKNKKAPRAGPSSCTIVQREPISSSGCRQLPILRQHHRIDGVNDSVRRDQIRLQDAGCVDAQVR